MTSWIKLHRKFAAWGWTSKPEMVSLFIHLLLAANYEDGFYLGKKVKRGQVIFGRIEWSKKLGISEQSMRTCMERLKSTSEVLVESTSKFSVITIVNYDYYQYTDKESTSNQPAISTSNQPASNQQPTTSKEGKKLRNKEEDNTPPTPQLDFLGDEPQKKPVKIPRNLRLDEVTVEILEPWVAKNIKSPIDIQRELLKCQSWDFKRTIKDGLATVRTWLLKAEDDYVKQSTGKVNKHGNFEQQDYRAGTEGFRKTLEPFTD